jgi:hypothetical protein
MGTSNGGYSQNMGYGMGGMQNFGGGGYGQGRGGGGYGGGGFGQGNNQYNAQWQQPQQNFGGGGYGQGWGNWMPQNQVYGQGRATWMPNQGFANTQNPNGNMPQMGNGGNRMPPIPMPSQPLMPNVRSDPYQSPPYFQLPPNGNGDSQFDSPSGVEMAPYNNSSMIDKEPRRLPPVRF